MLPDAAEGPSSASASPTPAKASGSKVAIAAMRVLTVRPPVPVRVVRVFIVCPPLLRGAADGRTTRSFVGFSLAQVKTMMITRWQCNYKSNIG